RTRHFFPLLYEPVPLPFTLRTAIADGQGCGDRDPKPMATRTFDFGGARRILILGHIRHLGAATLGAAHRGLLLRAAVDGPRKDLGVVLKLCLRLGLLPFPN